MAGFYNRAADILGKLSEKQGSIKGLIFNSDVHDKKRLYGVICETLKYKQPLEMIMEKADLLKWERKLNKNLALILCYELLFSRGISGQGNHKTTIMKHKTRLKAELVKLKIKMKAKKNEDLIPEHLRIQVVLPRYIRVNYNVTTVEKVIEHFIKKDGFTEIKDNLVFDLPPKTIRKDEHLQDLLLVPSNIDLHDHPLLLSGAIIMQDKASCFPATILNPEKNIHLIDACAAPGNKTSHLSSIMRNTGKIFAFDADKTRLETLKRLCQRAKCNNIDAIHTSFLDMQPKDPKFKNVKYILLDPSCSGSGIVSRLDHLIEDEQEKDEEETEQRLKALAEFQVKALLHAFSFPNVKKVVYSTCSKHQQENEDVVKTVLEVQDKFVLAQNVFPQWKRRGLDIIDGAHELVRTESKEDKTIGFFVALFEKESK